MTTETPHLQPPLAPVYAPSQHPDRTGWLIAFGVIEILFGLLYIGFAVVSFASILRRSGGGGRFTAVVVFTMLGILWFVLGAGSIAKREWSRRCIVAVSWVWLFVDSFLAVFFSCFVPIYVNEMAKQRDPGLGAGVLIVTIVFGCVLLAIPAAVMAFFYSRPSVKATCVSHSGPMPALPLIVNVLATWFIFAGCANVLAGVAYHRVALFGAVSGAFTTALVFGISAIVRLISAIQMLRLRVSGWWLAFGYSMFWLANMAGNYLLHKPLDTYRSVGTPARTIEMFQRHPAFLAGIVAFYFGSELVIVAALLWSKRYFVPVTPPVPPSFSESLPPVPESNPV